MQKSVNIIFSLRNSINIQNLSSNNKSTIIYDYSDFKILMKIITTTYTTSAAKTNIGRNKQINKQINNYTNKDI